MGPNPASPMLPPEEESTALAFRRPALLPLDDCLCALPETIPRLARSALRRRFQRYLFQRHGIRRLPGPKPAGKKSRHRPHRQAGLR